MIKALFTEKSTKLAKEGKYTFLVERGLTKDQIKAAISRLFGVHVIKVKTMKIGGEKGRNYRGRKVNKASVKKAVVNLKGDEKIDLFEEKKKKKGKKA